MKKKLAIIFLCTTIILSFVGCSFTEGFKDGYNKGKEVNNTSDNSQDKKEDSNAKEDATKFNVDWNKCIEDTKEELTNSEHFNYVKQLAIKVENDRITFTAILADSTSNDVALDFADTMLRRFSANAQLQDNSIKSGSKDYLGGLYDAYDISIGIAPLSKTNSQKDWYVFDAISKGVQREPKLQK